VFGRSRLAGIAISLGALTLAAACANGNAATKHTPSPTPEGPVLLTFAVYGPPQVVTAYTKIAADFSAAHPDIVVNIRPYDSDETEKAALAKQFTAGDPPDAFLASYGDLADLVKEKAVRPLDELLGKRQVDFGDGFQRAPLEDFSADNGLQCMPVDVSPLVVYYNTALVDLAALTEPGQKPITADTGWKMDTFALAAEQASRGPVRGVYVAPDFSQVAPFVWSAGGQLVDDPDNPTTLSLSDSASASGLEKLLEVVRNPQLTFGAQQIARRSAIQRFKTGKLAMILGYRNLTPELRAQQDLSFDVMPLPRVGAKATTGESTGLCLSKASEHPDKTADFLAYAVSSDAMAQLAATGYVVPTNVDAVNSDAFLQPGQYPANAQVFSAGVRSIHQFPAVDTWPSVAEHTQSLLSGLFYDPVIDPFEERLKAIDAASAPLFTPVPSPSPSATSTP
jgi:multiple sugar transport system substrate-binding protein